MPPDAQKQRQDADPSQPGKSTTTVALDFAHIVLDDGTPVLVYGLPGQDHFAFMRPIVLEGAAGAIILLDGRDADLARHCEDWLSSVASIAPAAAIAVGVTHTDLVPEFSLQPVRAAARCLGRPVPVFTLDARVNENGPAVLEPRGRAAGVRGLAAAPGPASGQRDGGGDHRGDDGEDHQAVEDAAVAL